MTATQAEFDYLLIGGMARRLRTRIEFAEQELIIPSGPFEGRRFSCERQPFARLLLEAMDSELWSRFFITGPTQSGKSFLGFVQPTMYHLFEYEEDVICLVPQMELAKEKWQVDLRPAIERSRYACFLPDKGAGSQGGTPSVIRFKNGASLRFIPGGGSDKTRAGYTARVVVITETDGMDESGETSREADPITQTEARTLAFGSRRRIYAECTLSTELGRTHREYMAGTASRIVLRCPKSGCSVIPERDSLYGWQGTETIVEAQQRAAFACPACGEFWTEQDRRAAHSGARLLHRGQEIGDDGAITGPVPGTDTFGFRWSAVNNLLLTAGDIAAKEWKAARDPNEANAEKEMCQFVWAIPHKPDATLMAPLDAQVLMHRIGTLRRGEVPSDCTWITVGVDIGRWLVHWAAVAWKADGTSFVIDYGRIETGAQELGEERGILTALRKLRDICSMGWRRGDGMMQPQQVWIDCGYSSDVVYAFVRESGNQQYKPLIGRGAGQRYKQQYKRPLDEANQKWLGDEYHISILKKEGLPLVEINTDHWKSWLHQRLTVPMAGTGSLVLFNAPPAEHMSIAKHWTAEHQVEEFEAGKGTVIRWDAIRRDNHWFDSTNYACAAGHFCGVRLVVPKRTVKAPEPPADESKRFVRVPAQRRSGGWFRR